MPIWLEYDAVAFAVLVFGIVVIELLVLIIWVLFSWACCADCKQQRSGSYRLCKIILGAQFFSGYPDSKHSWEL